MRLILIACLASASAYAQPTCSNGVLTGLDSLINQLTGPMPCADSYGSSINPWTFENTTYNNAVDNILANGGPGFAYGPWWADTGVGDVAWVIPNTTHIVSGGTGYAVSDTFTIDGGSVLARCTVETISGSAVASYKCAKPGNGYTTGTKATTAVTGGGSGLTLSVVTNEGTVSITAGSSTIVGVGTHLLQLCGGSAGVPPYDDHPKLAVVTTGSDGTQYVQFRVTYCTDDTHVTVANTYPSAPVGTMEDCSMGCNTRAFSWCTDIWPCSASYLFTSPMGYYDMPFGLWKRWQQSASTTYRDGFRNWSQWMWDAPWINHGNQILFDSGASFPFRTDTFSSLVLRSLDGHSEMWPGLRQMCTQAKDAFQTGTIWVTTNAIYDLREEMYATLRLVWCAAEDPVSGNRTTWRSALVDAATNVWTPFRTSNGAAWYGMGANEGSGIGTVSANIGTSSTPLFSGARLFSTMHLVNGSTTATLNSGTWSSSNFTGIGSGTTPTTASCGPRAQHYNGGCLVVIANPSNATAYPTTNSAFVDDYWSVDYVDTTHATLDHAWAGSTGDYGWIYDNPQVGWLAQPPFVALFGTTAEMAAYVFTAASDSTNAAIWQGYNDAVVAWLANAPLTSGGGAYSFGGTGNCATAPVPQTSMCAFESGVYFADSELTNELIRPLGLNYLRTASSSDLTLGDLFMSGIMCKTGACTLTPPANYNTNWDYPGGFNYVPPLGSTTMHKQFGQFFGFGGADTYPALRIGPSTSYGSSRKGNATAKGPVVIR